MATPAGKTAHVPPAPISRRFLVVDDSEDMRFIMTRITRRAAPDASIAAAKDGGEALEACATRATAKG